VCSVHEDFGSADDAAMGGAPAPVAGGGRKPIVGGAPGAEGTPLGGAVVIHAGMVAARPRPAIVRATSDLMRRGGGHLIKLNEEVKTKVFDGI
jgi:hypothetical protein